MGSADVPAIAAEWRAERMHDVLSSLQCVLQRKVAVHRPLYTRLDSQLKLLDQVDDQREYWLYPVSHRVKN